MQDKPQKINEIHIITKIDCMLITASKSWFEPILYKLPPTRAVKNRKLQYRKAQ